jgi:predicted nucleic acid-binding protein
MAKVLKLCQAYKVRDRELILDSNILVYRYYMDDNEKRGWVIRYHKSLKWLSEHGYHLAVERVVLSEMISIVSHDERERLKKKHPHLEYHDYKEFRTSPQGVEIMEELYRAVREELLVECKLINPVLTSADIQGICAVDSLDFVDKLLVLLCEKRNAVLVTNDSSFKSSAIEILSNNDRLFDAGESEME